MKRRDQGAPHRRSRRAIKTTKTSGREYVKRRTNIQNKKNEETKAGRKIQNATRLREDECEIRKKRGKHSLTDINTNNQGNDDE